jgi:DNA-binding HxlR family transcriptional regulator
MKRYGSFCPIAKAAEILAERWTLLLVRELLLGSRHFNDFRRGVPQMSPTTLSKRLQTLEAAGLVERAGGDDHREYRPTSACEDLRPIIEALGHWGQRWVRGRLTRDELDPGVLMWFIHRHFAPADLPQQRIVVRLEFTDLRRMKCWWLVLEKGHVDLCLDDPGFPVDIYLFTDLLTLTEIFMGDASFSGGLSSGKIIVDGPCSLTRSMPRWFARSKFADTKSAQADQRPARQRSGTVVECPPRTGKALSDARVTRDSAPGPKGPAGQRRQNGSLWRS